MTYLSHLKCSACQKHFDPDRLWNLCSDCAKPLIAEYELDSVRHQLQRDDLKKREQNMWRYQELLPVGKAAYRLSLGEGWTPLIRAEKLEKLFDFSQIYIKDEGLNPTGSFKARGLSVAVSRAWELGAKELSIPSAGNAAGAMSAYAALAGLPAHVYMPRDVPENFIAECKAYGAKVNLVDGLINNCGKQSLEDAVKFNRFDLSTLKEPYRVEGKKTMGYELAEQLDWKLPDIIIYPTGGGTGLIGMWKAFDEMQNLGWIDDFRPRMVCVQATGCAPLVKAFRENRKFADPWQNAKTNADGLRVPNAIGDFIILDILRESQGTAISISDEEMMEGAKIIGKTQGLFVSPETGATLAAFRKLKEKGWVKEQNRVVLFNTGSGYKYSHLWG
ncbi:MAG: threonine synthase [Calditrichia bacterium]|nr:threonine synthase [Calditrichia bacterium]